MFKFGILIKAYFTDTCRVSLTGKVVLKPTSSEKGTIFVTFENATRNPK